MGCHAGHTLIAVPPNRESALWTNLAPGAAVSASSTREYHEAKWLVDRHQFSTAEAHAWVTQNGDAAGQWVRLEFPAPVIVRAVRLWGARPRVDAGSTLAVNAATVILYKDQRDFRHGGGAGHEEEERGKDFHGCGFRAET